MNARPSAAVLVLNYNGLEHLKACLPSVAAVKYPRTRIVVVDNGSHDGSVDYVRTAHPGVEVIALPTNLGFAGAYNEAVRAVDADWVALLNNDTRVDDGWLDGLIAAASRHHAAAAAATILDWDGARVDFAGGLTAFTGHAWQVDQGEPVGRRYPERPVLFGCGGAVLFRREIYLAHGGLDDDYFMYFEDVDIGWRLTVMGHPTVFTPEAITYHRLHGTTRHLSPAPQLRLYERNALATIFKNYGDEALARVLPAAVALTVARSLARAELDGASVAFGRTVPSRAAIPPVLGGMLVALEDFARWLPRLRERRAVIQARRRVADDEVLALMPEPLKLHDLGDGYRNAAEALVRDFRIAELFGVPPPAARVTVPGPPAAIEGRAHGRHHDLVSVIVLTASGAQHLPECLDSLTRQDWPADGLEVIVVDNGSRQDPTREAERHVPGVRVVRLERNMGFAAGNNAGARVARGDWLFFLNDDTRVAPDGVSSLMAVASRHQAASVGARILDWSGQRIDFAGGLVNFEGRGYPLGWDQDASSFQTAEQPLLFACGAAALFRRDVFEEVGGWDEPTFAYYEDVELGWRLWLLGHDVWFAPDAIVYHKHHGTSGPESPARLRAFERNALRMLYGLTEARTLQQALPAALLLSMDRTVLATAFSRASDGDAAPPHTGLAERLQPGAVRGRLLHALSRRGAQRKFGTAENLRRVGVRGLAGAGIETVRDVIGGWEALSTRDRFLLERHSRAAQSGRDPETVPASVLAALLGVGDFIEMLPELSARRAWLQARRRRTDAEIVAAFGGHWRSAVPAPHQALHQALRSEVLDVLARTLGALPGPLDLRDARSS